MNILFFLTPKAICSYVYSDFSIRQALERMESTGYATIPILDRDGRYVGSLTEGDLLWAVKNLCGMDLKKTEGTGIMEIAHRKDYAPVSVNTDVEDLLAKGRVDFIFKADYSEGTALDETMKNIIRKMAIVDLLGEENVHQLRTIGGDVLPNQVRLFAE